MWWLRVKYLIYNKFKEALRNIECVRWKNNTNIFFSLSLKFGAYYITDQWGEFIIKMLLNAFMYIFGILLLFFIINVVFLSFLFFYFFLMKYQISPIFTVINFYRRRFFQIVRMSNFLCIKLFLLFFVKIKIWTAQNENQSIRFNTYIHTHAHTHTHTHKTIFQKNCVIFAFII